MNCIRIKRSFLGINFFSIMQKEMIYSMVHALLGKWLIEFRLCYFHFFLKKEFTRRVNVLSIMHQIVWPDIFFIVKTCFFSSEMRRCLINKSLCRIARWVWVCKYERSAKRELHSMNWFLFWIFFLSFSYLNGNRASNDAMIIIKMHLLNGITSFYWK